MSSEVWVWAERKGEKIARVSLELLGKGRELAQGLSGKMAVILLGNDLTQVSPELIAYGAEKVYLITDPRLEFYQSDVYAQLMANLIQQYQPEIVLLGATSLGKDLAARVAAKVNTGLTAHCIDLYLEQIAGKSQLVHIVPGWGGSIMLKIVCPEKRPQMATVRAGVLEKPKRDAARKGEVIQVSAQLRDEDFKARTMEIVEEKATVAPLEEAEIVVAGGWGLCSAGGIEPAKELAKILGGAVAGTRPVVDKGWLSEEQLVGQSGKTVSPRLFISLGASGAMHFTTGFLKSKIILAVDYNPQAPIFEACDIGIVGDLSEVLPCLRAEVQAFLGGSA